MPIPLKVNLYSNPKIEKSQIENVLNFRVTFELSLYHRSRMERIGELIDPFDLHPSPPPSKKKRKTKFLTRKKRKNFRQGMNEMNVYVVGIEGGGRGGKKKRKKEIELWMNRMKS